MVTDRLRPSGALIPYHHVPCPMKLSFFFEDQPRGPDLVSLGL